MKHEYTTLYSDYNGCLVDHKYFMDDFILQKYDLQQDVLRWMLNIFSNIVRSYEEDSKLISYKNGTLLTVGLSSKDEERVKSIIEFVEDNFVSLQDFDVAV